MNQPDESKGVKTDELPRRPGIFSKRLTRIVDELHKRLNGESQVETIPVVISLTELPIKGDRYERMRILESLRKINPNLFDYLEKQGIPYVSLGFSSGQIVANPTVRQLPGLETLEDVKEIDYAPNEFGAYLRAFKSKAL